MSVCRFGRVCICLTVVVLSLAALPTASPAQSASGHFEVYCDSIGFFLTKIDGAPAPGRLLLFLYTGFPWLRNVPKETWKDVSVFRDGCIADGKCEVLAHGKVWLDDEAVSDAARISGKYEIELNGQHLHGQFAAKRHYNKHSPRLCM